MSVSQQIGFSHVHSSKQIFLSAIIINMSQLQVDSWNLLVMQDGAQFVKKIGGVFAFKVKDGPNGKEATWFVDVKNGNGCVHNDTSKGANWHSTACENCLKLKIESHRSHPSALSLSSTAKKADCTISMSDTDLLALMTGKMNAQTVSICFPQRDL